METGTILLIIYILGYIACYLVMRWFAILTEEKISWIHIVVRLLLCLFSWIGVISTIISEFSVIWLEDIKRVEELKNKIKKKFYKWL